jgi:7,8-dihydroneopterin aldolase/epimerase/oxygenase
MSFIIGVSGLEVSCIIGCLEDERHKERTILLDIQIKATPKSKKFLDDVSQSVDYEKVASLATHIAKKGKFKLLESLAKEIVDKILDEFHLVDEVYVKVVKPKAISQSDYCFVEYESKR